MLEMRVLNRIAVSNSRGASSRVSRFICQCRRGPSARSFHSSPARRATTVFRSSFWISLLPKVLRHKLSPRPSTSPIRNPSTPTPISTPTSPSPSSVSVAPGSKRPPAKRGFFSNPASPYIILGLLIGSQSIRTIATKQEQDDVVRRANRRIRALRDVIEDLLGGTKLDEDEIRTRLGTGKEQDEAEWKEVIGYLETKDLIFPRGSSKTRTLPPAARLQSAAKAHPDAENETRRKKGKEHEHIDSGGREFGDVRSGTMMSGAGRQSSSLPDPIAKSSDTLPDTVKSFY